MFLLSAPHPAELYPPLVNQPIHTFYFTFDHGLIIPYILLLRFHPGMYISIEEWESSLVDGTQRARHVADAAVRGFYTALGHPTLHPWHTHAPKLEKWELI